MYGFKPDRITIIRTQYGLYDNVPFDANWRDYSSTLWDDLDEKVWSDLAISRKYLYGKITYVSNKLTNIPGGTDRGKESGITAKIRVFDSSITMNDKIEFNNQVYPIKSIRPVKYFSKGLEYEVII